MSESRPFDLNLLRSLQVLLETRNLTLAAEQLACTQSALSKQLARLRQQFDDPLLIRSGHHYVLSERAKALLPSLRASLDSVDQLWSPPQFDPASCTRQFTLGGSDYIADNMLPQLVEQLRTQAPALRLQFRMWQGRQLHELAGEEIDLVPTIANSLPDYLHGRVMGEDKAVCLMRYGHPLAAVAMSAHDYAAARHIQVGGGGDKDGPVDQALAQLGLQRTIHLGVPFYGTALRLTLLDDLLWTVPVHIAVQLARRADVCWQPLPFDMPVYRYWLLWHPRRHHDAAHQWFRQQVHAVLQASIHGVTHYNEHANSSGE